MNWLESNEFQRLLYFIYVWEIVDIRMIKKFQPYPKGRNWIQYLSSKEKWIKKGYRNCKNEKNHKWSGCVFKLTKKGCEEASFLWKLPKFKSNVSIITLQHNYICLCIIKDYLKIPDLQYKIGCELEYRVACAKDNKIVVPALYKSIKSEKSVDFIYHLPAEKGNIACEIELTMKSRKRYYGKDKHTVFKKIKRDFALGLFKRLDYYVPNSIIGSFQKMIDECPKQYKPEFPINVYSIEKCLSLYKETHKWLTIVSKSKDLSHKNSILSHKYEH